MTFNTSISSLVGLSLKPPTQEGTPGQSLTFNLELTGGAPKAVNSSGGWTACSRRRAMTSAFTVSFPDEGTHTIVARVVDSAGKVVLQAPGTAVIKARATTSATFNPLASLLQTKTIAGTFRGQATGKFWSTVAKESRLAYSQAPCPWDGPTGAMNITWNGASFSGSKNYTYGTYTTTETIQGTVSRTANPCSR